MKDGIHPKYGPATIRCACGNVIETRSTTQGNVQVEICSACHPFFTGRQKLMDTAGRIDRFQKKFGSKITLGNQKKQKKAEPAPEKIVRKPAATGQDIKTAFSKDKPAKA